MPFKTSYAFNLIKYASHNNSYKKFNLLKNKS